MKANFGKTLLFEDSEITVAEHYEEQENGKMLLVDLTDVNLEVVVKHGSDKNASDKNASDKNASEVLLHFQPRVEYNNQKEYFEITGLVGRDSLVEDDHTYQLVKDSDEELSEIEEQLYEFEYENEHFEQKHYLLKEFIADMIIRAANTYMKEKDYTVSFTYNVYQDGREETI